MVKTIKDIFENNDELSKEIIESKKPMIVFGESFFKIKSQMFFEINEFVLCLYIEIIYI